MAQLLTTSLYSDPNLQGYWRVENGALVTDSGPNGRTLTNNNTVGETTGRWGGAADFGNGNTNKSLSIANQSFGITNQDSFSIALWAKLTEAQTDEEQDVPFSFVNNGYGIFFIRIYKPTGNPSQVDLIRNNGLTQESDNWITDPGTTSWHHYALTVSGTTMRFYVDGADQGAIACSGVAGGSTTLFTIGSNQNASSWFDGYIDDVAIFNDVLTAAEVSLLAGTSSPSASVSPSASISPSGSASRSASPSASLSPSASVSRSVSPSSSASRSASPSASKSPSGSISPSPSLSASPSSSISPSVSPSGSPSAGYSDFSREQLSSLPGTDSNLGTLYTEAEEIKVSSENNILVGQDGSGNYMIHQFRHFVGSATACKLTTIFQSTLAPISSTVYLQVYNRTTAEWETVDSNSTEASDTNFELTAEIRDLTQYKGSISIVSFRVYQYSNP